eukprot:m.99165 g.99165  ORF g.99165 m.99165 type:complete len:2211 (+) comp37045_c0_seq2:40-6672(+)
MSKRELPHLSTALRAFGGISEPSSDSKALELAANLQRKRKLRREKKLKSSNAQWAQTVGIFKDNCDHQSFREAEKLLKNLCECAAGIVGEESDSGVTREAAAFLFRLLYESDHIGRKESMEIKQTFGPFPAAQATKAHATVTRLATLLPSTVNLDSLLHPVEKPGTEFGAKIKFSFPSVDNGLLPLDGFSEDALERLNDTKEKSTKVGFEDMLTPEFISKIVNDSLALKVDNGVASAREKGDGGGGGEEKNVHSVDASWLRRCCESHFVKGVSGMSVADMFSMLFDILSSTRSDDDIQNELFDLLGFEKFDLIQEMLTNRHEIIHSTLSGSLDEIAAGFSGKRSKKQVNATQQPSLSSQVTIQSREEKEIRKWQRREEKKLARREAAFCKQSGVADDEDREKFLKTLGFDPDKLREEREKSLLSAANAPLFSNKDKAVASRGPIYPHVYDAKLEARRSGAYIAGSKLLLPENVVRTNTRMFEEVRIPSLEPVPFDDRSPLIRVSDLDDLLQIAFRSTRKLNRIQSIVYPAAYETNENLLVCAPTGAGKTNVAMMAVLRELRCNMDSNVIKKDEFKVIYVAPMKALAAEMVRTFGDRLAPLGIAVRELTGDMQMTKAEIQRTQMIVTTPEKWDVVTRKGQGDVSLTNAVKLLIIDEVHLLHESRGAVIESLVARTLRQVESTQMMIRIVGLSATLPNYIDVARFLRVNPLVGLFYFDTRFRPVPLNQTFIGVKSPNILQRIHDTDRICYDKAFDQVSDGHQVMVFVHARNGTVKTAITMRDFALNEGQSGVFLPEQGPDWGSAEKQVSKSRNHSIRELFPYGFGIHHAGMLRSDRNLMESLFVRGLIRVLVCTATLAWGINLPAHAVIIKGTQVYDSKKGSFVDLGILDVLQIFGRAGRPQFDKIGEGMIITAHEKLSRYLSLLTQQQPIESQFTDRLVDNLNAEIALGTVASVEEAVQWLSYTYLFVRMHLNPLVYGIPYGAKQKDPELEQYRTELIVSTAKQLDAARMIRFDPRTRSLSITDLGRTASHFYIQHASVLVFNELFKPHMTEADILTMVAKSNEFEQIKVRDEEANELQDLLQNTCVLPVKGGTENSYGKVNILLQAFVCRAMVDTFSLVSDMAYVAQNGARIIRGLFEVALRRGWPIMAGRLLTLCKSVDRRLWSFENSLRQFSSLSHEIQTKLEIQKLTVDRMRDMRAEEIGHMVRHVRMGGQLKRCADQFPSVGLAASIQPITRTILRVRLTIEPLFDWNDRVHGMTSEPWWIWVEDAENDHMYYSEYFLLQRKQVIEKECQTLVFTIPIFEPLPPQYFVRAVSDRWLGAEAVAAISFQHLILPERHPPHTDLLDLQPLPVAALKRKRLESLYSFSHFNPIQTQIFHTMYHSDANVLLGAPTGSGKTVAAELAMFRVFREYPGQKVVYIAPLKALVRERIKDWRERLQRQLNKSVVELTGDFSPDVLAIAAADVIVTTPEKWDGVSRSWQNRPYVLSVALLVIDEIHLLGGQRGPVLEVIVSRTNFISSHTEKRVRVVGLSTALANARDLADWLGIEEVGLFNFRPSVRPVPLEVHINGFPGKHYCPRMATMNKPTFTAIRSHSPAKPTLVFVASRRQTRLTALDLISYLAASENPKQWLHLPEREMGSLISNVRETNLKLTLAFGIGIHHAGLHERDRKTVEELFVNQKIQVLVATSTLAWGVNFPAHLVVVKGTEYYDGKTHRYIDFPITDVLQMMGRAGRPQFDDKGVAVIFVHDVKKQFYKKFLYEPFPVESSLLEVLPDHLNAEIVAGTVMSKQDCMDYITWTYFFRRLIMNPSYYDLDDVQDTAMNEFLSGLVQKALNELATSNCVEVAEDDRTLLPTVLGRIASFYYLHNRTVKSFDERLAREMTLEDLLQVLTDACEYDDLPVRHNEDNVNETLAKQLPIDVSQQGFDSPHVKTHLLLQAHFCRASLPMTDYLTDTKSVLDQAIRILQAMIDVVSNEGWLSTALQTMQLIQMTVQGRWIHDSSLLTLPGIEHHHMQYFLHSRKRSLECLPELMDVATGKPAVLHSILDRVLAKHKISEIYDVLLELPQIRVSIQLKGEAVVENATRGTDVTGSNERNKVWTLLHTDRECVSQVTLTRIPTGAKRVESKAHAPCFPKAKDEGWWLVLGDVESGELVALKRVGFVRKTTRINLAFYTPETAGRKIYTLYVMSDSYLGLDQQHDINVEMKPEN